MDIFTLEYTGTTYANGKIVNGLDSKLWVERFWTPGEFTFVCRPTTDILEQLSIGTLISHTDSQTIMIVEDHEITESKDSDPILKITGRSLEAIMEYRMATNSGFGFSPANNDGTQKEWEKANVVSLSNMAVNIIKDCFIYLEAFQNSWVVPQLQVVSLTSISQDSDDVELDRGPLLSVISEVLKEYDASIKTIRPGYYDANKITFAIFKGADKSSTVQFSHTAGEIHEAKYFWSSRSNFNAAYASSKYGVKYRESGSTTGFDRRVGYVDATRLNFKPTEAGDTVKLQNMLSKRYNRWLKKQNKKRIIDATIASSTRYKYRVDYNVGDLVWVKGNYGISEKLRVLEFAETEDENGEYGYPSLAADE